MKTLRSVLALCLLAQPFTVQATPPDNPTWWINFGMGTGSNFKNDTAPIQSAANGQFSFNGRFTPHTFLTLYFDDLSRGVDTRDYKSQSDIGIMYGYISRQRSTYWSASAGICYYQTAAQREYSWRNNYAWYEHSYVEKTSGAGLPVQVQAFWTPFRHFGLGLIGHAVASKDPSMSGMLAIQVF